MKICFIFNHRLLLANNENGAYLARAALQMGHSVHFALMDSLACHNDVVHAAITPVDNTLTIKTVFTKEQFADSPLSNFDVVWAMSFGGRAAFADRLQLLYVLAQQVRVINHPNALFFLHSKISQHAIGEIIKYPKTYSSSSFDQLWQVFQTGGDWIVKPAGESLGHGVFKLTEKDSNARGLLQMMTGYDSSRYCLLQRYIPEVENGEKRVLMAGGEVVGYYSKKTTDGDHRGNMFQNAKAELCELTPEEKAGCERVGKYLLNKGAYFSGLDISWPYLLEWNVLNPGGIGTIDQLGGGNIAGTVLEKILFGSSQTLANALY